MRILHGVVQQACGDESGGVCHVNHQQGAHLVGNVAHPLVVPFAGVGRAAAHDEFGLLAQGDFLHLVIVHAACFLVQVVFAGRVEDAGAVGEVSAMCQVEAHELVAGVEHGQEHGSVGLCAGVGLHVGPFGSEYLLDAFDGQLLALVHHFATAVVALAGIAFGVFVGQAGTHGLHHFVAQSSRLFSYS